MGVRGEDWPEFSAVVIAAIRLGGVAWPDGAVSFHMARDPRYYVDVYVGGEPTPLTEWQYNDIIHACKQAGLPWK